jgi:two-component system CheB/CheR fusion protein
VQTNNELVFEWRETNGPPVRQPVKLGFGLKLLNKEVEYGLRGKIELDFDSEGLRVILRCMI